MSGPAAVLLVPSLLLAATSAPAPPAPPPVGARFDDQIGGPSPPVAGVWVVGFDVAIAEECQVYAECAAYTRVDGRSVIEIEDSDDTDDGRRAFARA